MSFDIYVLVPEASWPTPRQLEDAMIEAGWPARLGERLPEAWNEPLAPISGEPLRYVVQDPEQANLLGVSIGHEFVTPIETVMPIALGEKLLDPDFGMETLDDPQEVNDTLQGLEAPRRAKSGDKLVWFSHHVDQWNYNAAMYVLAALILKFAGYGFELQGSSHGTQSFADELLTSLYPDPVE